MPPLVHNSALRIAALLMLCAAMLQPVYAAPGDCPQPRFTGEAPVEYLDRANPLAPDADHRAAALALYNGKPGALSCAICHGSKGDGKGPLASLYDPPPRNFACARTVNGVPDGQLFWIIRFGSPGTAMPPHPKLDDTQVWQLVWQLRQLAK